MLELVGGCGRLLNDKVTCTDLFAEVSSLLTCQLLAFGSNFVGLFGKVLMGVFWKTQI